MPQRKSKKQTETKPEESTEKSIAKFRREFPKLNVPLGGLPYAKTKISNITSEQLGDLIARYSAWREYCEDCHITAAAEYSIAKLAYDEAVGREMVVIDAGDVTTKKAMAQQTKSVKLQSQNLLEKEVYFKMIANKLESFSNTLTVLSRELTRRGITNL